MLAHLQQVIKVGAEAVGKAIEQLAECKVSAGGEGVAVRAKGAGQTDTDLQHVGLGVFLHNATYVSQQ